MHARQSIPRTLVSAVLCAAIGAAFLLPGGCESCERCDPATPGAAASGGSGSQAPLKGLLYVQFQTTAGDLTIELDADRAPISVANFLAYVEAGEYNGTIFHRVIPGFVVQGGGYGLDFVERKGREPIANEWQNGLKNVRGTIAMARDAAPDTATREFYFNCVDNARLDSARAKTDNAGYAVFGRVVRGMDVIDAIRVRPTSPRPEKEMQDVPVEPVILVRALRVAAR